MRVTEDSESSGAWPEDEMMGKWKLGHWRGCCTGQLGRDRGPAVPGGRVSPSLQSAQGLGSGEDPSQDCQRGHWMGSVTSSLGAALGRPRSFGISRPGGEPERRRDVKTKTVRKQSILQPCAEHSGPDSCSRVCPPMLPSL